MNTILLILGVLLIIFSITLITINSTNSNNKQEESKVEEKLDEIDFNCEYNASKSKLKETSEQVISKKEDIDLEDEILSRNFSDIRENISFKQDYLNASENNNSKTSITDEIISMYIDDGLKVNEIAKKLEKGIREIEIILKVNNITK